jgi:hypothetical protein
MKRISLIVALGLALLSRPIGAQEKLGSGAPEQTYRAGWTFTPTVGVGETYDTNVALFSTGHDGTQDYIATVFPGADLHYYGKHTSMDMGYTGAWLDYRTFNALNRWDQRAKFNIRQEETARFTWYGHATAALLPSTDLLELGGIPYRKTGARTMDGRGGVEYVLSSRDSLNSSLNYQTVDFDRPVVEPDSLRGGRILESATAWRHKVTERAAVGADYSYRRALVTGDPEAFNFHTTEAALDYRLSPSWSFSGAAGIVYLEQTSLFASKLGPAFRATFERRENRTTFHVGYLRTFIPSFGYGGTVESQDVGVGFRTPLFNARRFYIDGSAVFRDNQPLTGNSVIIDPTTGVVDQLPLRSLRAHTILGWEPQPWVRFEVFYALVQQTSTHVGGYLDRNRVGFQIVTSKPMRIE